jgi:hypothetical protein
MDYWPARIATRSVAGGSEGVLRQVRNCRILTAGAFGLQGTLSVVAEDSVQNSDCC